MDAEWIEGFPGAVTVCDRTGVILSLNAAAAEAYRDRGGRALIGKNLLDCHPEPSRTRLARLLESGERNVYTIEKAGKKKLIYQVPWFRGGERAGLVEIALELPRDMPHFVREG